MSALSGSFPSRTAIELQELQRQGQLQVATADAFRALVAQQGLEQLRRRNQAKLDAWMAQARRASDECIFMLMGELIEHGRTEELFLSPKNPKTAEYIEGRYG